MDTLKEITDIIKQNDRFIILSHIRPDGDAIGSTIAIGSTLEAMGKTVTYVNEDGVPDSLAFLHGSNKITKASGEALDVEVAIAVDCANKPRLGDKSIAMAENAKLWINIDHHKSNPGYGDFNHVDSGSPATGQILYNLITENDLPFTDEARDSIYVAVSTDTGSFQYSGTTAATYEMAADLVRRGVDTGKINELTYDSFPYRRIALTRELLNTLELSANGAIADWQLHRSVKHDLNLKAEDSEDLIDMIQGNCRYIPGLYVLNKIDQITIEELDILNKLPNCVPISAHHEWNLDGLLERIWERLDLIRIFTKPKGQIPDFNAPIILPRSKCTIENFCMRIHKSLRHTFKHANVWGTSVRYNPQKCGLSHVLEDGDVVQLVKK